MKYISTRGRSPKLNFSEVLLGGLAPDGGLYLPEHYPNFTDDELNDMRDMSYQDLAFYIFEKSIYFRYQKWNKNIDLVRLKKFPLI